MSLRALTWLISFAIHGAVGWYFLADIRSSAYALGSGSDDFIVEQGMMVEGAALLGQDAETVQAVEAEPVEMSQARPEIEEVKPREVEEETKVVASESGPEQPDLPQEPEEKVEQKKQMATLEQVSELPVEEKQAAGAQKLGGDASTLKAYQGLLFSHLKKKIVRPRGGERVGRVMVRFTLDPSGEVLSREVAQSSGHKAVDDAALATIDKASPFPPAPRELANGPQVHTVPFSYRVE